MWYGSAGAPGSSCVPILPARRGLSLTPPQSWDSLRVICAPALGRGDEPAGRRRAVGRSVPGLQDLGQTRDASQLLPRARWRPAESNDEISAAGAGRLEGQRTDGKQGVLQSARCPLGTAQVQRAALGSLQGGLLSRRVRLCFDLSGDSRSQRPRVSRSPRSALSVRYGGRRAVLVVWLETSVVRTFIVFCVRLVWGRVLIRVSTGVTPLVASQGSARQGTRCCPGPRPALPWGTDGDLRSGVRSRCNSGTFFPWRRGGMCLTLVALAAGEGLALAGHAALWPRAWGPRSRRAQRSRGFGSRRSEEVVASRKNKRRKCRHSC